MEDSSGVPPRPVNLLQISTASLQTVTDHDEVGLG